MRSDNEPHRKRWCFTSNIHESESEKQGQLKASKKNGLFSNVTGGVINTLCGYRTLNKERLELLDVIHVRGCIHAVGLWLKDNFEATLGIVCSLLLPQMGFHPIFRRDFVLLRKVET
ncbi:hypothetical protein AV530_001543 [Patagioenas fasciata monilis]|uniref:Uncharacterized protein n=1 Tax=Patagioenas fasciata monilis TaxID=372326 RepID=A0A1V4KR46_PATFA|nr:hypothetical protein AV530_001543 [Patagioenas fasciata monilis]